ncbi:nicotinamide-nucleotide amidohydrolase family protein [Thiohalobacter sp. IOR34]|uniref:CinA family protein n=1 Tax=Thiohalobacter sp. IOR34 TaxID=3057176 RepID=UPI0025AF212F|nr:nicotinamide-nucleotide amidohydrolase family protein [Thiohalobacter sp. IOR34]WJW74738.1 nicotinamide-nucleotide amidohydrolase family protein [Thiohalobacter sp. IOR34]
MAGESGRERDIAGLARALGEAAQAAGVKLATAESCTGGWLAKVITDVPGCSAWFERGFVTYSNASKQEMLGVSAATLETQGAVSEATVAEMAAGALAHSRAQLAVAISGIAGPGGATPGKPVGMVCFAFAREGRPPRSETEYFIGDREAVRLQAVGYALHGLLDALGD